MNAIIPIPMPIILNSGGGGNVDNITFPFQVMLVFTLAYCFYGMVCLVVLVALDTPDLKDLSPLGKVFFAGVIIPRKLLIFLFKGK